MQLGSAFVHYFDICLLRHNYVIYLFDQVTFFDDVLIKLFFDMFELRMEITLQFRFIFAPHCDVFLLRYNYVIYLFYVVTFFDNVRIALYFGTFELRLEITLQLRCLCSSLWCNFITSQWRSFITSQLRYLFVQCSYVFW